MVGAVRRVALELQSRSSDSGVQKKLGTLFRLKRDETRVSRAYLSRDASVTSERSEPRGE